MTSSNSELKKISMELKNISLKRQQLEDRKKLLLIFQELRNRAEFGQTGDMEEIDAIIIPNLTEFLCCVWHLCIIYVFVYFLLPEEAAASQQEINSINNRLKELNEKTTELQRSYDNILNSKNRNSKKGMFFFPTAGHYSDI